MRKIISILIVISVFFVLPSNSNSKEKEFKIKDKAFYFSQEQIKNFKLQPPPEEKSIEDEKDLEELKKIQDERTDDDCEKAISQKHANFEDFFGKDNPFPSPLPKKVKKILKLIKEDTDVVVNYYKNLYARQRPFNRNKGIETCFSQKAGGYSYPSGHATISRVYALILSDLLPEKKETFIKLADQAALNRVVWGVHHPSDVEAGKFLAHKVYANLSSNKDFVKKMELLKKYIRKEK